MRGNVAKNNYSSEKHSSSQSEGVLCNAIGCTFGIHAVLGVQCSHEGAAFQTVCIMIEFQKKANNLDIFILATNSQPFVGFSAHLHFTGGIDGQGVMAGDWLQLSFFRAVVFLQCDDADDTMISGMR